MPFGGGGALHTGALIKEVGLKSALVPRYPGVTSALGCVIADMRHDRVMTINQMLEDLDVGALDRQMSETAGVGQELLDKADVIFEGTEYLFELDMHYLGQTHTVSVPLPLQFAQGTTGVTAKVIRDAFENTYRQTYGRLLDGIAIRIMNLRVTVVGRRPKFDLSILAPKSDGGGETGPTGTRQVWAEGAWHEAATYERLALPEGTRVPGPAILEQPDTTIFIDPDLEGRVDCFGNLVITRKEEG